MTEDFNWAKLVPELYVSNIEESLKFYIDIIGFTVCYGREENKFSYIDLQGSQFMLVEFNPNNKPWVLDKLEKPFGRGISFQMEVSDVKLMYDRVKKGNCTIFLDYHEKGYRSDDIMIILEQFIIVDPDGYLLRFFQHIRDEAL